MDAAAAVSVALVGVSTYLQWAAGRPRLQVSVNLGDDLVDGLDPRDMRMRICDLGVAVVLIVTACSGPPAASTGASGDQFTGQTLTVQSWGGQWLRSRRRPSGLLLNPWVR